MHGDADDLPRRPAAGREESGTSMKPQRRSSGRGNIKQRQEFFRCLPTKPAVRRPGQRGPVLMLCVAAVAIAGTTSTAAATNTHAQKLMFFDESSVASLRAVVRTMHQPQFAGVAVRPTEKWEDAGIGAYNSVVDWSPTEKRLYYTCLSTYEQRNQLCMAVSQDGGKSWHKPILNVATFMNSTANNIVVPAFCSSDCADTVESGNVWRDERPGVGMDERWKLFVLSNGHGLSRDPKFWHGGQHLWLLASGDGINWRPLYDQPSYAGIDDTETTSAGWNAQLGKYMVYIRDYTTYDSNLSATYCYDRSMPSGRMVGLCLTENLRNLSGTCSCILRSKAPDPVEYDKDGMPTLDVYTSGATPYANDYVLLFPSFFHHFASYANNSAGPWPGTDHDGLLDIRFMYSRIAQTEGAATVTLPDYVDARNGRAPFVPLGVNRCEFQGFESEAGGWCDPHSSSELERTSSRTSMTYFTPGYLLDSRREELSLFSSAMPFTHGSGWVGAGKNNTAVERWRLRVDGFASLDGDYSFASDELPTAITRRVKLQRCQHDNMSLELHVNTITSVVGYVKIGLAITTHTGGLSKNDSSSSNAVAARSSMFTLQASNAIRGNFIRRPASWGVPGTATYVQALDDLAGQEIVATIQMPDAKLFSLTFECVPGTPSPAPAPPPPSPPIPKPHHYSLATNLTGDSFLFIDDTYIANTSNNIGRRWHTFEKEPEPYFTYEADEGSGLFPYHSVIPPDAHSPLYRLYYDCYIDVWGVCLATSKDGRSWQRPQLGIVTVIGAQNSEPPNIVLSRTSNHQVRGVVPKEPVVCTARHIRNASFSAIKATCRDAAVTLIYTPWDADQPYKLMTYNYNYDIGDKLYPRVFDGFYSAWSHDGAHFTDNNRTNPALPNDPPSHQTGDLASFGYDYHTQRYMVASRYRSNASTDYCSDSPPKTFPGWSPGQCRCIGWAWSEDYKTWPKQPQRILCPDSIDDRWAKDTTHTGNHTEFYNMAPFAYGQQQKNDGEKARGVQYLGLIWVSRFTPPDLHGKGNNEGTMHIELAFSHNGTSWERPSPIQHTGSGLRPELISRGRPGTWNSEMLMTSNTPYLLRQTMKQPPPPGSLAAGNAEATTLPFDVIRLSYIGCPFRHHTHAQKGIKWRPCALGWATLRKDGFASMALPKDSSQMRGGERSTRSVSSTTAMGTLTTKPLDVLLVTSAATGFSSPRKALSLWVNYETATVGSDSRGSLAVEVLDMHGHVIPGFSAQQCVHLQGNTTNQLVSWTVATTMPTLASKTQWQQQRTQLPPQAVSFRFVLSDMVQLYSFAVRPASSSP